MWGGSRPGSWVLGPSAFCAQRPGCLLGTHRVLGPVRPCPSLSPSCTEPSPLLPVLQGPPSTYIWLRLCKEYRRERDVGGTVLKVGELPCSPRGNRFMLHQEPGEVQGSRSSESPEREGLGVQAPWAPGTPHGPRDKVQALAGRTGPCDSCHPLTPSPRLQAGPLLLPVVWPAPSPSVALLLVPWGPGHKSF